MSKLNLRRAQRTTVQTSAGEVTLRPLNALDISELVDQFDLETIELTTRIVNHVQAKRDFSELLTNPEIFSDLFRSLPQLIVSAINLVAGGDDDDLEAIRELPAEDIALLTAKLVAISLERIGGLGKLLDLMSEATGRLNDAFEVEMQKRQSEAPNNTETNS